MIGIGVGGTGVGGKAVGELEIGGAEVGGFAVLLGWTDVLDGGAAVCVTVAAGAFVEVAPAIAVEALSGTPVRGVDVSKI